MLFSMQLFLFVSFQTRSAVLLANTTEACHHCPFGGLATCHHDFWKKSTRERGQEAEEGVGSVHPGGGSVDWGKQWTALTAANGCRGGTGGTSYEIALDKWRLKRWGIQQSWKSQWRSNVRENTAKKRVWRRSCGRFGFCFATRVLMSGW